MVRMRGGLRQGRDAVLRERADAAGGGDADLGGLLDAAGDAGELLGHDVVATRRVTLDGGAVAADDALDAGTRLLDVALELVAGLDAAALIAGLELLELALGGLARAERAGERAGGADHAVAGLERGADVGQRRTAGERADLLRADAGGALVGVDGVTRLVAGLRAHAAARGAGRRGARGGAARGRLASSRLALRGGLASSAVGGGAGGAGGVLGHFCFPPALRVGLQL